jgi:hypothetical protein
VCRKDVNSELHDALQYNPMFGGLCQHVQSKVGTIARSARLDLTHHGRPDPESLSESRPLSPERVDDVAERIRGEARAACSDTHKCGTIERDGILCSVTVHVR